MDSESIFIFALIMGFSFAVTAHAQSGVGRAQIVTADEMSAAAKFYDDRVAAMTVSSVPARMQDVRGVKQGWGVFQLGWSVNHRILTLKGRQFQSGFGTHADAEIEYTLPAGVKKFSGLCGIDETEEATKFPRPVQFSIELDGKEIWRGDKPQTANDDPAAFDLDVTGGKVLRLVAVAPAHDVTYTPVDFVDLKVTLADGRTIEPGQRTQFRRPEGPCVSFVYGGGPSADFLSTWKLDQETLPETPTYTSQKITRTDPAAGLAVSVTIRKYKHFPVVEWIANFKNKGDKNTPIIEKIRSTDLSFPSTDALLLHHHTGDYAAADSYEPHVAELATGTTLRFAPQAGRPTDKAWPYYNIENTTEKNGIIAVVGWAGQWAAEFAQSATEPRVLDLSAGQELTHFVLHPGEEARTPIAVFMFYDGDHVRSQNVWRRWMLEENTPRPGGKMPEWVNGASLGLLQSEKSEIDGIELFEKNGAELNYWWMDAGWYPCTTMWWDGVGTWEPDPVRFPRGVKAVSDVAHANGLKLILWYEPERVHEGTWLDKNKPEFLLSTGGSEKLFDLGNPAAWQWMLDHLDGSFKSQGVDLYRQDFNHDPLPFWRANDKPDRQGITEMRHVEGYLKLWDELQKRHPKMLIDTCASGGRRLDLETLRRSVPLWRCDDSNDPEHNQCQTIGMAPWIPMFGSGTGCDTAYTIRSQMIPFFTLGMAPPGKEMDWELYRRESANWKKIRELQIGDYYPLLSYSRDLQAWVAWQFDRPDLGSGVVQAFRRPNSPFQVAKFPLKSLDAEATYQIANVDSPGETITLTGKQLMETGVEIRMDAAPAATILIYTKVK